MQGVIRSIESFATKDGPGIRCAVFFSGCNLRCKCCHNADTWSGEGRRMESGALAERIARFKPYFGAEGGATFSGGEPLLQAEFAAETADLLHRRGISVVLDTSGSVSGPAADRLLDRTDLVLLDLKQPTEAHYRDFCGGSLDATLAFARNVRAHGVRLILRTVIIPGLNDTESDLAAYHEISRDLGAERYELLGFHTMGFSKFEACGLENPFRNTPAMDAQALAALQKKLDGWRA